MDTRQVAADGAIRVPDAMTDAPAPDAAIDASPDAQTMEDGGDVRDGSVDAGFDADISPTCLRPEIDGGDDPGVIQGDVNPISQADINALAGIREVTGRLVIGADIGTNDIVDLTPLACLQRVGIYLQVRNSPLESLHGLESLTTVDGTLQVYQLAHLRDLRGLRNVTHAGGLSIFSNPRLVDLDGLQGIRMLAGFCEVARMESLTSLLGLDSLEQVGDGLLIYLNPRLSRCDAEAFATRVGALCESFGTIPQINCTEICRCTGNLNDITCE